MNVRDAMPTIEEWKLLMNCTYTNLDASTKELFDKVIHLFATNVDVQNHNKWCLRNLNFHVSTSVSTKGRSKFYTMEIDKEDLELELRIPVGARVMLTSNIWTDFGLINGALVFVEQIVYDLGCLPPKPPTYVLIRFDNYVGFPWDESFPWTVSITPIERGSQKQLPLKLVWGLTIHKSQGLTL